MVEESTEYVLVEHPDGSVTVGVDLVKRNELSALRERQQKERQDRVDADVEAQRRMTLELLLLSNPEDIPWDNMDPVSYQRVIHWRRKRSFIFLLSMDCSFLILSVLVALTTDIPSWVAIPYAANCLMDIFGLYAAHKEHVGMLSAFLAFEAIAVVFYGLVAFSPLFLVRVVILILGTQLRNGILLLQSMEADDRPSAPEQLEV